MNHVSNMETKESASKRTNQLGFWSAILTAMLAASAFALGIITPPRSGPFCQSGCITYPYPDVASFVPRDYLWMYPGIVLAMVFVMLVACIHYCTREDQKVFSLIGFSFAVISATLISTDYLIQLFVLQPSLLKGELEGLSLFSQYNPHGIFIALENVGYLMMSLAFLFASAAFSGTTGLERTIRWLFIVGSIAAIGSLIVLSLLYGNDLEYRFEVTILTINWTVLIIAGVLLGIFFKRAE